MPAPSQPPMRRFGDYGATRDAIYGNALSAVQGLPPVENSRYRLEMTDLGWAGTGAFTPADHKNALLTGRSLTRRLTGAYRLVDKASGNIVDQTRRMTVAAVPHLTDQGTFVTDGTASVLSHQLRLDPGIYTRRKDSGEVEGHVAVLPGGGVPHRVRLDPETGVFRVDVGQAELPVATLLKAFGATDDDLRKTWGPELAAANLKAAKPHHLDKYWDRFGPPGPPPEDKAAALTERLSKYRFDPWVTKRTLGAPYQTYGKDPLLALTGKLIRVARGAEEPDDRDNPAFASVWGPEHLIPERLARASPVLAKALWQATNQGNLKGITPGLLSGAVRSVFTKSGLAVQPEGVGALEFADHGSRITKVGEGGIGRSADSIPRAARDVNPGQFPFIDPVRASESESVGVDLRTAFGTRVGSDRRIYAPLRDARTGKIVFKNPRDVADATVAFPGGDPSLPVVPAVQNGRLTYARRDKVDYVVPSMEQAFSPLTNMVPLKSSMKAHRSSMGARMISQALPLVNGEAPLVRTQVPGQPGKSFEELFGRHVGAVFARPDQPGRVESVKPGEVVVRYADGTKDTHPLYESHPSGRKTRMHQEPLVKPGDPVAPGQILVKSNFTDDKGHAAHGLNARIGFMSYKNRTYEDSWVIGQSFADRLKSDHLYHHYVPKDEHTQIAKDAHAAAFPGKYTLDVLKTIGDDGAVKPGTTVSRGDPLVLAVRNRPGKFARLSRSGRLGLADASETWDHDEPGVVTDVAHGPHGTSVMVNTTKSLKDGDKMCYSADTEVLTDAGWKPVATVTPADRVASLADGRRLEYLHPSAVHRYPHIGKVYALDTTQVSLRVTADHCLYARLRGADDYRLVRAEEMFGRRYRMKTDAEWDGEEPATVTLPGSGYTRACGRGGRGVKDIPPVTMPTETYLMLLGMFLTDGSVYYSPNDGNYGLVVSQVKPRHREAAKAALTTAGVKFVETPDRFIVYGRGLAEHLRQYDKTPNKRIPDFVFAYSRRLLKILFDWMYWGNGSDTGTSMSFTTGSKAVADGYQRLCLHVGYVGRVGVCPAEDKPDTIKGVPVKTKSDSYRVGVYRAKFNPEINHAHVGEQSGQSERWEDYAGDVYCVTLPKNHVLYVRRDGKAVWCGNSGRHGNKGVVVIVPDHHMPVAEDGKPLDVIQSSLGVISRTNPSLIFESLLGKIARKNNNTPYAVDAFDGRNVGDWVRAEADKHGVKFRENLTDPATGRTIPNVGVGVGYVMKLHHLSEAKAKGRGLGSYDETGQPLRGQSGGAMRASLGDTHALLGAGATDFLHDAHMLRGQSSDDFWVRYMSGFPTTRPTNSKAFDRFLTELKAAGVNPVREGDRFHFKALTGKDVEKIAGDRVVTSGETLDLSRDARPVKDGLHDPDIFGAVDSASTWGRIPLHEPVLNPVFEEPARRLLGLTGQKFRDLIAGKHEIKTGTGMKAVVDALNRVDVPKELARTRTALETANKSDRDDLYRKLRYLKALDRTRQSPADWVWNSVPVMPPAYRPVTPGGSRGDAVVSDQNLIYRDVIEANKALKGLSGLAGDVGAERLNLYDAVAASAGLGEPVSAKNKERGVKGVLARLLGDTAKQSFVQTKLLGTPTNLSGRGAVLPNPDLDMDEIGLPESVAREVYHPFMVRRLVRSGVPRVEAARQVADFAPAAKKALLDEMAERPVTATRYPVLHRFNVQGFKPRLVPGDAIHFNNVMTKSMSMDFDGDQQFNSVIVAVDRFTRLALLSELPQSFWESRDVTARFRTSVPMEHKDGVTYHVLRLEDFPHGEAIRTKDHVTFHAVPPGLRVVAYDETRNRPVLAEVAYWSVHRDREVEIVDLQSGRQIVTDDDPRAVYGLDPKTFEFVRRRPSEAAGLHVPRVDRFDAAAAGLTEVAFEATPGDPTTVKLTPEFGYLAGVMAGNGWVSGPAGSVVQVHLACTDSGVEARFRSSLSSAFTDPYIGRQVVRADGDAGGYGPSARLTYSSTSAARLFAGVVGRGARNKHLPPFYLAGDAAFRKALLEGLMDTDGSVSFSGGKAKRQLLVNYSSASLRLVQEIQHLCRSLGVMATISPTKTQSGDSFWVLNLSTPDIQRLGLGLTHTTKTANLAEAEPADTGCGGYLRNHMVPIPSEVACAAGQAEYAVNKASSLYHALAKAKKTGRLAREKAKDVVARFPDVVTTDLGRRFATIVADESTVWDVVETFQRTGVRETGYDLTVPGYETFMSSDGIILSNTVTVQTPMSEEAVKEVYEKLLPSKNILSPATMKATVALPNMEFLQGAHYASTADDKNHPVEFKTLKDAVAAHNRGEIGYGTRIRITGSDG